MLSKEEFFDELAKIPGVRIEGDIVHGIGLLTP